MQTILIFVWIIGAFVAMGFWEAYIEGQNPWARKQVGWKKRISKNWLLTGYHFWVYMMLLAFLSLPLVTSGFSWRLAGIILSATAIGVNLEDFMWFVVNPYYGWKKFTPKYATWYRWTRIGPINLPTSYYVGFIIAVLSWIFLWR